MHPAIPMLQYLKKTCGWDLCKALTATVPNPKWVKWMEEDIGLIREKTKDGKTLWRLG